MKKISSAFVIKILLVKKILRYYAIILQKLESNENVEIISKTFDFISYFLSL